MLHCISACCTVAQDPPLQVHLTAFIALSGTTSTLSFSKGMWNEYIGLSFHRMLMILTCQPEKSTHILLLKLITLNEFLNLSTTSTLSFSKSSQGTDLEDRHTTVPLCELCMFFVIFKDITWVTGEREDRRPVRRSKMFSIRQPAKSLENLAFSEHHSAFTGIFSCPQESGLTYKNPP